MTKINAFKPSLSLFVGASLLVAAVVVLILPAVTNAAALNRQLQTGMSGSDVSTLQTFLAQDVSLYPQGLVTGYFGFLTKAAVSNFQTRNGIEAVGRVGPVTLPVLNLQIANGMNGGNTYATQAPTITSVSTSVNRNNATISWSTNENANGLVYYNTSPLMLTEHINSVDVGNGNSTMTDMSYRTSQSVGLSNLQPNTTYYYMVYTTDQTGNVSVTWPSTFQTSN